MPQTVCQLCGVSFEIARCRRPSSPPSHAIGDPFVIHYNSTSSCEQRGRATCGARPRSPVFQSAGPTFEHVAGPGCSHSRGYGGFAIGFEEMEGCRNVQFLQPKSGEGWSEEAGDAEWEKEGGYFLTGVGEGDPGDTGVRVSPVRHGVTAVRASNVWMQPPLLEAQQGMLEERVGHGTAESVPFHPWCFSIFEYVSTERLGAADVHGLYMWRVLDCSTHEAFFECFPRDFAVYDNQNRAWGDHWGHMRGSEYLAANPLAIPGFENVINRFRSITNQEESSSTPRHERRAREENSTVSVDPFQRLPSELRLEILESLSHKDVANLRLVSRGFSRLPNSLFRRFLMEDMPWFVEARSLPVDQVDWFRLYRAVKFYGQNLKGLKNRKRIWKDVEEIVARIAAYRRAGVIQRWDPRSTTASQKPHLPPYWAQIHPPSHHSSQDLSQYQAASYLDITEPVGQWAMTDPLLETLHLSQQRVKGSWLTELCTWPRSFCSVDSTGGLGEVFDYLVGASFRDSIDPIGGVVTYSCYAFLCRHLYFAKLEFRCSEPEEEEGGRKARSLLPLWHLCTAVLPPAVRDFLLAFDDPERSHPGIPGWSYDVALATESNAGGLDATSDPVLDILVDAAIVAACSGHAEVCGALERAMPGLVDAVKEKLAAANEGPSPAAGMDDRFASELARLLPTAMKVLAGSVSRRSDLVPHTRRGVVEVERTAAQIWDEAAPLAMAIAEKVALARKPVEHPSLRVYTAGFEKWEQLFMGEFCRFWWVNTPLVGCLEVARLVLRFL